MATRPAWSSENHQIGGEGRGIRFITDLEDDGKSFIEEAQLEIMVTGRWGRRECFTW